MFGNITSIAIYLYKAACFFYTWICYLITGEQSENTNSPMCALLDDLLKSATVDYTNKEIKDIVSAVEELVKRYVDHFNRTCVPNLRIIRIQPCGSMAEKTSLWKWFSVFAETITKTCPCNTQTFLKL